MGVNRWVHADLPLMKLMSPIGMDQMAGHLRKYFNQAVAKPGVRHLFREKLKQVGGAAIQTRKVELPHRLGLGQFVHQFIKAVDQALDANLTTQGFIRGHGSCDFQRYFLR
jgi:hypothetical protein